jgi:hypothetical protein
MIWNKYVGPIGLLGLCSLVGMAISGRQSGGKSLHWVYRALIVLFFLLLFLLFYLGRH